MKSTIGLLVFIFVLSGCSSFGKKLRSFITGSPPQSPAQRTAKYKFSDNPNFAPDIGEKQYRRVNKEIFEKEGMLEENSGSLWVMEGQGSYLFSQNLVRVSGDVVNITLDGVPRTSLEKKVDIIKTLLEKSRRQTFRTVAQNTGQGQAGPNSAAKGAQGAQGAGAQGNSGQAQNSPPAGTDATGVAGDDKAEAEEEKKSTFDVSSIPSRIVEKNLDGSYRIKGSQSFMIGRREYRVIATGVVRPSDIRNDAIEASRLVDSKFDLVAIKKEQK